MNCLIFLTLSFKTKYFCTTFFLPLTWLSPVEDNALVTARGDAATTLMLQEKYMLSELEKCSLCECIKPFMFSCFVSLAEAGKANLF